MSTDEELMCAYAEGDKLAFDELFSRYSGAVHNFMRKDLWRPEEARDLTQQVFLQLHRSRNDFRASGNLRSWLMTIARNLKYDYMRRFKRTPTASGIDGPEREQAVTDDSHRRLLARDALDHAIGSLPENQQAVIRLYWFEHLPYAEIARRLDASESAVKVRAHRAYKALRTTLESSGGGADAGEK